MKEVVANPNNKKIEKLFRSFFENKDIFVQQLVNCLWLKEGEV